MRFITTLYLLFVVWLEASYSYFTLIEFEKCENSNSSSFNDGDIALRCEGELQNDDICKIHGYSYGFDVVFNYTLPKNPDSENNLDFEYMVVEATAFGNGASGRGYQKNCKLFNEKGERDFPTLQEGDKVIARCNVPIDLFGNSINVVGRIKMDISPGYRNRDYGYTFDRYGELDPTVTKCAIHAILWI